MSLKSVNHTGEVNYIHPRFTDFHRSLFHIIYYSPGLSMGMLNGSKKIKWRLKIEHFKKQDLDVFNKCGDSHWKRDYTREIVFTYILSLIYCCLFDTFLCICSV